MISLPDTASVQLLARVNREPEEALSPSEGIGYERAKRGVDLVLSCVFLLALAPVMLIVAVLVKLTSRGPVIFRQERAGQDGRPFTMYKFRSMANGAEDDRPLLARRNETNGPVFKIARDPRLTRIGRFLRRSSLDELPQLVNVLKGEMSLVGPRPLWVPEARQAIGAARLRTSVKPGLTCLWQISGRSELSYEKWVLLDLYYIRHRSMLLDLAILIQTIPAVLSGHGAY